MRHFLQLSNVIFLLVFSHHLSAQSTIQAPVKKSAHYSGNIDFYGRHFSGILTIKRTDSINTRLVFTSVTGFKYFDMQVGDSVTMIYCIEPLHRKNVLTLLKEDLAYLVRVTSDMKVKKWVKKTNSIKLKFAPRKKFSVIYLIENGETENAAKITIKHKGLLVKYAFELLKE